MREYLIPENIEKMFARSRGKKCVSTKYHTISAYESGKKCVSILYHTTNMVKNGWASFTRKYYENIKRDKKCVSILYRPILGKVQNAWVFCTENIYFRIYILCKILKKLPWNMKWKNGKATYRGYWRPSYPYNCLLLQAKKGGVPSLPFSHTLSSPNEKQELSN